MTVAQIPHARRAIQRLTASLYWWLVGMRPEVAEREIAAGRLGVC